MTHEALMDLIVVGLMIGLPAAGLIFYAWISR